jgi:hypothetical protein
MNTGKTFQFTLSHIELLILTSTSVYKLQNCTLFSHALRRIPFNRTLKILSDSVVGFSGGNMLLL